MYNNTLIIIIIIIIMIVSSVTGYLIYKSNPNPKPNFYCVPNENLLSNCKLIEDIPNIKNISGGPYNTISDCQKQCNNC